MSTERGRSVAEWTTFAVSAFVLVVVMAVIGARSMGSRSAAAPVAEIVGVETVAGRHHVQVEVTNEGDETAANVHVVAELALEGGATTAEQTVDFLAGDQDVDLVFIFDDDPSAGELTVAVGGFAIP